MAREYGPTLQKRLTEAGINLDTAFIGASALKRAPQTAALLFPGAKIQAVPHLTEAGRVPVNTPAGGLKHESSWPLALSYLAKEAEKGRDQFILIGHGNYMKYDIIPKMSGLTDTDRDAWVGNLDTLVIRGFLTKAGHLLQPNAIKITYDGRLTVESKGDRCRLPRSLSYIRALARRTKKQQLRSQEQGQGQIKIGGFFTPSVMGTFAANGARLIPIATYLGYKMYKNRRTQKIRKKRKSPAVRT